MGILTDQGCVLGLSDGLGSFLRDEADLPEEQAALGTRT
jgi:hypothetical protein